MSIRAESEIEYDEMVARSPRWWDPKGRARTVDRWLVIDMSYAVRTLHLSRYRDPAAKQAIVEAREAIHKLNKMLSLDARNREKARRK